MVAKDIKTFRDHQYDQLANSFLSGPAIAIYCTAKLVTNYPFLVVVVVAGGGGFTF